MNQTFTIKEKLKQIFILLIPILITQLGMFAMVFFNTVLSGNYHSSALAGVAIGTSIWNPVFIGLSGILLAVSPIAAQYCGEKRNTDVSFVMTHGVYLGLAIAVLVIAAGVFFLEPLLDAMKLDAAVRKVAHGYLTGMGLGVIPLFLFTALRSFIYALGNTRIVMIILLLALPVNLFFNYVLIFGKGCSPNWAVPAGVCDRCYLLVYFSVNDLCFKIETALCALRQMEIFQGIFLEEMCRNIKKLEFRWGFPCFSRPACLRRLPF